MLATMRDAVREYATNVGHERPTVQWILSDYDSWEPNPFYVGPDLGHPECDGKAGEVFLTFKDASDFAKGYAAASGSAVKVENYQNRCWVVMY
jgi:hypothetical protein